MNVLLTIQVEPLLVVFVSHTVLYFRPEHHLRALHEVGHDVFQLGHHSFLINKVEIYLIFVCNLNSYVALDEVKRMPFLVELIVL